MTLPQARWARRNWQAWNPRLFEWYFTRTRPGIGMRTQEEAAIWAGVLPRVAPGQRVADIGSGTGHYAVSLATRCASVVAVEPNPAMRRYLRERLLAGAIGNVAVQPGHLPAGLGLVEPVDGVVCVGVLQYVADLPAALAALTAPLVPGGWIAFTATPVTLPSRGYAVAERCAQRRIHLRDDAALLAAAEAARLEVHDITTAAGLTRVVHATRR